MLTPFYRRKALSRCARFILFRNERLGFDLKEDDLDLKDSVDVDGEESRINITAEEDETLKAFYF